MFHYIFLYSEVGVCIEAMAGIARQTHARSGHSTSQRRTASARDDNLAAPVWRSGVCTTGRQQPYGEDGGGRMARRTCTPDTTATARAPDWPAGRDGAQDQERIDEVIAGRPAPGRPGDVITHQSYGRRLCIPQWFVPQGRVLSPLPNQDRSYTCAVWSPFFLQLLCFR